MKKSVLILSIFFFNFVHTQSDFANSFNSIVGLWQIKSTTNSISYESWTYENDSTYNGKSYIIKNGIDTLVLETIQLLKINSEIFYIPTVQDQNNKKPIPFKLTSTFKKVFVFENAEHDFPQKIIYQFLNHDYILATIEGELNGVFTKRDFHLKK